MLGHEFRVVIFDMLPPVCFGIAYIGLVCETLTTATTVSALYLLVCAALSVVDSGDETCGR